VKTCLSLLNPSLAEEIVQVDFRNDLEMDPSKKPVDIPETSVLAIASHVSLIQEIVARLLTCKGGPWVRLHCDCFLALT
jgi:hypothetical protein